MTSKRLFDTLACEQMYAAGYGCLPIRSARRPRRWRVIGRGLLVVGCVALAGFGWAQAVADGAEPVYASVTVQPGDTLWSIAGRRYPGDDTRLRVDQIMRINRLSGPLIEVGEALKVPAR